MEARACYPFPARETRKRDSILQGLWGKLALPPNVVLFLVSLTWKRCSHLASTERRT